MRCNASIGSIKVLPRISSYDPARAGLRRTHGCDGLEAALRAAGNPERAEPERRYLKTDLEVVGAAVADIRRLAKALHRSEPVLARSAVVALVDEVWRRPLFECRLAAVELLVAYAPALGVEDLAMVERMVREAKTWALVDPLAINVAGPLVERHAGRAAAGARRLGARRRLLGAPQRLAGAPAAIAPRRRRFRPIRALCRRHAGGARVLHSQGDRLGAAGDRAAPPRAGRRLAGTAHSPGVRGDRTRGSQALPDDVRAALLARRNG
jgi:hypothetical protein